MDYTLTEIITKAGRYLIKGGSGSFAATTIKSTLADLPKPWDFEGLFVNFAPTVQTTGSDTIKVSVPEEVQDTIEEYWLYLLSDVAVIDNDSPSLVVPYSTNPQDISLAGKEFSGQYVVIAKDKNNKLSSVSNIGVIYNTCFPAGTEVLMADGSFKTIESIKAGDTVCAFNCTSYNYCDAAVKRVKTGSSDTLVAVEVTQDENSPDHSSWSIYGDNQITVAQGHLLFTDNGWKSVGIEKEGYKQLQVGDLILATPATFEKNTTGEILKQKLKDLRVTNIIITKVDPIDVYDLVLSDKETEFTYFAGNTYWFFESRTHGGGCN